MKIQFPKKSNAEVIKDLKNILTGRSLGDMVSLEESGSDLLMKVSKLGTSTLTFTRSETASHVQFALTNEKIAFAHKSFKDEVKAKLCQVVEKAGGTVLES